MIVFIGASPRGLSGVSVSWAGSVRAIRRARTEIVNVPISRGKSSDLPAFQRTAAAQQAISRAYAALSTLFGLR
jgi:hypothetical protein